MRLICFMLIFLGLSCFQHCVSAQTKLSPEDFEAMLKSDSSIQLVDVRTPEEFNAGHIGGAQNLNIQDSDFAKRINKLDKTRPVLVYCALGGRSSKAASQMVKKDFPKVYDLDGGITAWKSAGKAVEK